MAESFAFSIADKLLGKATDLAVEQVCLAGRVYNELDNFKSTVSAVKAVLLDAEEQQSNNRQLTDWLGKLKECFYDAEDVLDEFQYESLQREVVNEEGGIGRKVRHFFSASNPLAVRFKMGNKIKGIRERLDKIAADADKFNLKKMGIPAPVPHREREKTYSFVRPSDVIGRDGDKDSIIKFLMQSSNDGDSEKNVSVLPIVGIGGLGKTTLAKFVYNDERVVRHFEERMWVCVSDDFDLKKLIKEIITSATHGGCDDLPVDELQLRLRNVLSDKKFLLVLDDVWSKNRDKWLELKSLVDVGAKGSKIIVTTRDKVVADVMGTHPMYELEGLSVEECLSIFISRAFKEGEDKRYPGLVGIGKDIVTKCKGVPLAVKTLGGLLYLKRVENDWARVRDSEIWQLEQKNDGILPALKLSYDDLSFDVKQCLAFCSLFPEDFEFNNIDLVHMWMGLGLVQPLDHKKEEDIGNQYIDELLQISFFQVGEKDIMGFIRYFKMHDLARDLALLVARPEYAMLNFDCKNISTRVRHVSILKSFWPKEEEKVSRYFGKLNNNIRTILSPYIYEDPRAGSDSFVATCILRFKCIRVLNFHGSKFEELPHSICNLKLLRYLDVSGNVNIKRLPDSLCKLHHLQTLSLCECESLEELPRNIGKMRSLRNLSVTTQQMALLPHKEREVGRRCFNSLRLLAIEGSCLESLVEMPSLRALIILDCPRLLSLPKHLPALETLAIHNCESLEFDLSNGEREDDSPSFGSLRHLVFSKLPRLEILPRWLLHGPSSNTLLYLHIRECVNFRAFSEEEETLDLTFLDTLMIDDCQRFSRLPEGMDHFTALTRLGIRRCTQLSALPEKMTHLSTLTHLEIIECPQLSALPEKMTHLSALTHLIIRGCPELAKRCKRGTGEDWNKIAHVQHLLITHSDEGITDE